MRDTSLWKRLNEGFPGADEETAKRLALNLAQVCDEMSARMKAMPTLMPQFTLHDHVHGTRVTRMVPRLGFPAAICPLPR